MQNKKKIVITGPALSSSGYGRMCRFALQALRKHEDKIDLYLLITSWGNTSQVIKHNEEINWIYEIANKTNLYVQQNNNNYNFDVSIQISIPNEWKKIAPLNIGYTAGIETNFISPAWLQPSQEMNKIIVISEHAKSSFINTVFNNEKQEMFRVTTPVEVCHFPVKNYKDVELNLDLKHDFNFLSICQWGPRKNLEQTIVSFLEEFKNENVGLVLKINSVNDSIIDRETTEERLKSLINIHGADKKCSVTLIHGQMTDEEINQLYKHPKIKAIVSSTHGEGFGFPLFEAAYNELPVIATDWSGHLDFLTMPDENNVNKKMFAKVDCQISPIAEQHVWQGVLEAGTCWAYPVHNHLKTRMREVYKDYSRFKSWSKKLNKYIRDNFAEDKIYDNFFYSLGLFSRPKNLQPRPINGLSFCIPTNGKRLEKTVKTIKSITSQNWNNLPYEIIISGDVENFEGLQFPYIKLLNKKEEAHSRKVSVLRNSAAGLAKYENIIFCDDDILLDKDWLDKTIEYSKINGWEVLGNKVFSPDGTRYWDRSTLNPHILVDYDYNFNDKNLYQSSAFFMIRKEVFEKVKWDETKLVYADREGGIPEDVQYSYNLLENNYCFSFNKDSLVWHNDDKYTEFNTANYSQTLTKDILREKFNYEFFLPEDEEYIKLLDFLNE